MTDLTALVIFGLFLGSVEPCDTHPERPEFGCDFEPQPDYAGEEQYKAPLVSPPPLTMPLCHTGEFTNLDTGKCEELRIDNFHTGEGHD